LDSGFNDDRVAQGAEPPATETVQSPAVQRFVSCRWRRPAENGQPEHCGHRDVLPMAGTTGFTPDSWCADCGYYKAKRTPRKPQPRDEEIWRRW
jgi:hypothetical protein